jgi:hypothetical protein
VTAASTASASASAAAKIGNGSGAQHEKAINDMAWRQGAKAKNSLKIESSEKGAAIISKISASLTKISNSASVSRCAALAAQRKASVAIMASARKQRQKTPATA